MYFAIESLRMVHLFPVTQLMYHDRIEYFERCQHQQTIEVEVSPGRATSPSGLLMADRDSAVCDAYQLCVVLHTFRNHFTSFSDKIV